VPYPGAWNGSLWTLYFEFVCYVVTWVLGAFAIYRRSIAAIAAVWAISVGARFLTTMGVTGGLDGDFLQLVRLFGFFAGGALVFAIVDRFGLQTSIGVASVPIAGALMAFVPDVGGQLAAPFLGYALIFLATVVPQPTWISRNDVSYGFYIYAWPVQQLTILAGGMALGFPGYVALTIAITFVLAWVSWVAVERPVMRRVRERPTPVVPVGDGQRA
jgi:peptidoglycan/LPS O-acetylase OafA/YrhL